MVSRAVQMTKAMRDLEASYLHGVEGVTELWLVRHGDCYTDMSVDTDPPLSAVGRDQAARLGARLARLGQVAVYSSPYRRAFETARAISEQVTIEDRLVEMALELGPGGELNFQESPADVAARMSAAIDSIALAHPGARAVVVTHGAALMAYLADVLRLEAGRLRLLPFYTSVSVVRALGDVRRVGSLGDVSHLE